MMIFQPYRGKKCSPVEILIICKIGIDIFVGSLYNNKADFQHAVGVYCGEGPPVPIPNTEVKLIRAENTWRETAREDRSAPTFLLVFRPVDGGSVFIPQ